MQNSILNKGKLSTIKMGKSKSKPVFLEVIITTLFLVLLFASPILLGNFEGRINWRHVIDIWLRYLPLLFLYAINRFVLVPHFFFKKRYLSYFLVAGTVIICLAATSFLINSKLKVHNEHLPKQHKKEFPDNPINDKRKPPPPPPAARYVNFIILSILVVGFDTGLKVSSRWAKIEKEQAELNKENIENQLAFLRNQVSPHFLMNTLNNIHALVDIDSEEAKEAIIKLSKLMRYLLYEAESGVVTIRKEIDFIESYIELMRLRFSEKVKIDIKLINSIPEKTIPPLLFTSLLENAFKHGISYNNASFIKIQISFYEEKLQFSISNSVQVHKNELQDSGIGIPNTRKRLDLLYKSSYTLEINKNEHEHIVNLTIPV